MIQPFRSGSSAPLLAKWAREELNRRRQDLAETTLARAVKPYTPHPPSDKQRAFLSLDCLEAGYGGAAGGGKSDALIMAALQYVDVPGYSAILFRKTKTDLERDTMIKDRCDQWFSNTAARWDQKAYCWRFPTLPGQADATVGFGYWLPSTQPTPASIQAAKDRYQGGEWQFIGIDELGQWRRSEYLFLFSRLRPLKRVTMTALPAAGSSTITRSPAPGAASATPPPTRVPIRMRSTFNPGGVGHEDNKSRFIAHARQEGSGLQYKEYNALRKEKKPLPEPPYFISPPSREVEELAKELAVPAPRPVFVPAYASDNPGLDVAAYRINLALLDPVERKQLDDGDWDAVASGKIFKRGYFRYIDPEELRLHYRRVKTVRYWDLAATDPEKVIRKGKDPDWTAGVRMSLYRRRDEPRAPVLLEARPLEQAGVRPLPRRKLIVVVEHVIRFKKDAGDVETEIAAVAAEDGRQVPVFIEEEPGSSGKNTTHSYATGVLFGYLMEGHKKTGPKPAFWKPVAAQGKHGNLYLVRAVWNEEFIRELVSLPDGTHDDQADAAGGAFAKLLENIGAMRARLMAQLT